MKLTHKQSVILGIIIRFILLIGVSITIAIVLNSCYTQHKAEKQVDKALDEFPSVVANIARQEFPCVKFDTVTNQYFDTSEYVLQRDSLKNLAELFKSNADSAIAKLKADSSYVNGACKDYEMIIDTLYAENTKLALRLDNIKPILKTIEKFIPVKDEAESFSLRDSLLKLHDKYTIDHDYRIKRENRETGRLAVYIPYWLLVLLAVGLVLTIFLKLKK